MKNEKFEGLHFRINKDHKQQFVELLVEKSFEKCQKIIDEGLMRFADDVYQYFYKNYQTLLTHQMPSWWSQHRKYINISIDAFKLGWDLDFEMSEDQIFPKLSGKDTPFLDKTEYPEFNKRLETLSQEQSKLNAERFRRKAKVRAVIDQFSTTKQLYENWPEAFTIFIEQFPPPQKNEIMIIREDLNRELGLGDETSDTV